MAYRMIPKFESAALTIELRGHYKDRKKFISTVAHLRGHSRGRQELHHFPFSVCHLSLPVSLPRLGASPPRAPRFQQRRHPAMLGASLSRRDEMSARRPLLRSGAAHDTYRRKILRLYFCFRLGVPRRHGVARRHRRSRSAGVRLYVRRFPVRTGLERSVQCEDRQSRAEQQPGDRFEIIPAAHLRLALVAEIARPQAETRLHRVPAFGAKVGLVEDDFHRSSRAV
jgi:hypothetical protein